MTLKTLERYARAVAQQCAHATMREFNGFMPRSRVHARVSAERNCIRLRNCVSTCLWCLVSLNGMHIYGVTGLAWLGSAWLGSGLVVAVVYTLLDSRGAGGD